MGTSESGRSRTDIETLRRAGRAKVLTLGLLITAALGAAIWTFTRPEGIGNAEDPTKVLVVTDGSSSGYSFVLGELGFDAAEGTLQAWEDKAKQEVEELDAAGVEAVLTLADKFGYAYVVFESPQQVSFGELDLDGATQPFEDHVQFAVLTAGDYAFPHHVTVNPKPSAVMRDRSLVLLQALFDQERLQRLLPEHADDEEIADIQLRDQLEGAVDRVGRIPEAERMAERVMVDVRRQLVDEERADPAPRPLAESIESADVIPLPSGAILSVGRGFQIVSPDGVRADLDLDEEERFSYGPVQGDAKRQLCSSLAGGTLSVHDSPRHVFSVDGAAVVVKTLSSGTVLWRFETDAPPGSCSFESVGEIATAQPGLEGAIVPHGSGKVARSGVLGSHAVVAVSDVVDGNEYLLGMLDEVELGAPVWLGSDVVATVGTRVSNPDAAGIYVFSIANPMIVLRLDSTVFESATDVEQIAVVPTSSDLVATAGVMPRKLYRLKVPVSWSALFQEAAASPPPPDPEAQEDRPAIVELDPNRFTAVSLTEQGRVHDPFVSPDGELVAFAVRDPSLDEPDEADDDEVAVVSLSAGRVRVLTRNALHDHGPRVTADGKHIVFRTRVEIPRTNWVVTVPRIVGLRQ